MGVRYPGLGSNAITNTTITTTAETIVATLPALNLAIDYEMVLLFWYAVLTTGAGTTALTARLRRGSTATGTAVNTPTAIAASASTAVNLAGSYIDTPGIVASQQYVLTLQATGASGNATVADVCISAICL